MHDVKPTFENQLCNSHKNVKHFTKKYKIILNCYNLATFTFKKKI